MNMSSDFFWSTVTDMTAPTSPGHALNPSSPETMCNWMTSSPANGFAMAINSKNRAGLIDATLSDCPNFLRHSDTRVVCGGPRVMDSPSGSCNFPVYSAVGGLINQEVCLLVSPSLVRNRRSVCAVQIYPDTVFVDPFWFFEQPYRVTCFDIYGPEHSGKTVAASDVRNALNFWKIFKGVVNAVLKVFGGGGTKNAKINSGNQKNNNNGCGINICCCNCKISCTINSKSDIRRLPLSIQKMFPQSALDILDNITNILSPTMTAQPPQPNHYIIIFINKNYYI